MRNRLPFLLKPAGKDYLWGGNRLNDDFSKNINCIPLAETWECSTHPDGVSMIDSGVYSGKLLSDVIRENPEMLGYNLKGASELPILIKFIDAKYDLSVQVHPDDAYAGLNENGARGKTELWYVLDAKKDSKLVYGFSGDMDKAAVKTCIENGTLEKYLQKVPIKKDDVFYIEAGTIHAIGAGSLIVEIQENSNITYRLYDYDRVDKNGKKRELHISRALDVLNLKSSSEPKQPLRVLKYTQGCASEILCACKYFLVERLLINTERSKGLFHFQTRSNSFVVLLCIGGCGVAFFRDKEYIPFFKGDCIFIPANSELCKIHGKVQFLKVSC